MENQNGVAATTAIPIVTMTPAWAQSILSRNENNRNVRKTALERYTRDMAAGRWKMTGDPIVIGRSGNLIQGQHRLLACIASDTSFEVPLLEGAEDALWGYMDTGTARTLGDVLRRDGWVQASLVASAVNLALKWSLGEIDNQWWPSHQEGVIFAQANPNLKNAVNVGRRVKSGDVKGWNLTALTVLSHFTALDDQEAHDAFFEALAKGVGLYDGDPILAIRRWVARMGASTGQSMERNHMLAMYVKAWNAWVQNRRLTHVHWRRSGARREEFPILVNQYGEPISLKGEGALANSAR